MSYYETVFIARQDLSQGQVETLTGGVVETITNAGGHIARQESWGLRSLAYRIKKNRKGHYVLLNFEAPPTVVATLERNFNLNENILRYLTIRTTELPTEPSMMMRQQSERFPASDKRREGRHEDSDTQAKAEEPATEESQSEASQDDDDVQTQDTE